MIHKNDKHKALKTIQRNEYVQIIEVLKTKVYKNKKKYVRRIKHKNKHNES
jgi:hypothetical protein